MRSSKGKFCNRLKGAFAESSPAKQVGVFYPTQRAYMFRQLQEPEEPKHLYANSHAKRGKSKKITTFNINLRLTKLETSKVIKILIFYTMSYIKKKQKQKTNQPKPQREE